MATQVVALLNDAELWGRFGAAGRTYLLENFVWREFTGTLVHFYLGSGD